MYVGNGHMGNGHVGNDHLGNGHVDLHRRSSPVQVANHGPRSGRLLLIYNRNWRFRQY